MPIVKGFRRFHSNIVSSRQVVTEVSNLVSRSNVEQSRCYSAAPITSNKPVRKKVNSAERRAMLESFVNRYRAMNLGRFPSPTSAQKEVGGSYYIIKKMLQEMEYNFKMSSVEKGPTMENRRQIKGDDALSPERAMESSESQEKSNGQINIDQSLCEVPELESRSNFDKERDTGTSNIARDDTNTANESDEKPKWNMRNDNFAKDEESNVGKQSDEIRNITREEGEKDNELREKAPSLWGNLKSFANEIVNMWKK
ncbi:hypothetical protein SSX86_016940 [Deinandra increscens subsp. villosa]|uniref:AT3G52170-like helix-turn-helix domain-containing protein n=1 Tax=Deinandra increscens subsp. villosa TaxID=3103831 RepID=A0AAP0CU61_9ASTR